MRSTPLEWHRTPSAAWPQTEAKIRTIEEEVLAFLPSCGQPPTRVELERAISGSPLDVSDALHNLAVADLIELNELRVTLQSGRITRPTAGTVTALPLRPRAVCANRTSRLLVRERAAGRSKQ